jgi:geranylgeranylglycerol-phosphate geranylgeranyltransferase
VEYLIAFLITFISAAGAFSINDYYDYKIDKVNERTDRPLIQELVTRKTALITAIISFFIVIILSLFLNLIAMVFVIINLPLFYIYSMGLKKMILVKNLLIAYSYVATILLGSLVSDAFLEPLIIYFAIMGFIIGFGSEVMFDIADIQGDKDSGIQTIPSKFGLKKAATVAVISYVIIIIMDPLTFFILIDDRLYFDYIFLILILIPVISYVFLSKSLLKNQSKENTVKLRKIIFVIMQIGTIAYLIGVLV